MTEQDLLDLKEKVETAKTNVSELTGQLNALKKQLRDDWDCKSIEEANEKLQGMEQNITILEKKIAKGVKELEEKYNAEEDDNNN